jgi:REP element-mobilizing transposase RayT
MSNGGYKIRNKEGIHFVTFAVVQWIDVFTRKEYKDILVESLKHCQQERGLVLYSWCIMSNHVHLVVSAEKNDTSDILRDFKKYTSKTIVKAIIDHPGESRKEWMLELFSRAGEQNIRNSLYQFWRQDNHPMELFSVGFTRQKLEYIHHNPVEAGIVNKAEEYLYSSARDYYEGKHVGLLNIEFLD